LGSFTSMCVKSNAQDPRSKTKAQKRNTSHQKVAT
jgi:hypothetical protein